MCGSEGARVGAHRPAGSVRCSPRARARPCLALVRTDAADTHAAPFPALRFRPASAPFLRPRHPALFTLWSLDLLEQTCRFVSSPQRVGGGSADASSLEALGRAVSGPRCEAFVRGCLVVALFFAQIVFIVLLGDLVAPVAQHYAGDGSPFARRWVIMALGTGLVYPLALLEDLTSLAQASLAGLLCLAYLVVALLSVGLHRIATGNRSDFQWVRWPPARETLYVPALQGLAFCCQFNLPPLMAEMRDASKGNLRKVKWVSVALALGLYAPVALVGYVTFGSNVQGDILRDNFQISETAITVGRVALALTLVLKYPLILQPMRTTLNGMLPAGMQRALGATKSDGADGSECSPVVDAEAPLLSNRNGVDSPSEAEAADSAGGAATISWQRRKQRSAVALETALIMGTALFISAVIPNVQQVFSLAGAFSGGVVCFNLPAYLALKAPLPSVRDRTKAHIINVFGIVVTIVSLIVSIMDMA